MKKVAIIDYGMGNLDSVARPLSSCNCPVDGCLSGIRRCHSLTHPFEFDNHDMLRKLTDEKMVWFIVFHVVKNPVSDSFVRHVAVISLL